MPLLLIDLRTDFRPGEDFTYIETHLVKRDDSRKSYYWNASAGAVDYEAGARIAEFPRLENGDYLVVVKLLDRFARGVALRKVLLDLRENYGLTVVISR